jgi:hypothetical protein
MFMPLEIPDAMDHWNPTAFRASLVFTIDCVNFGHNYDFETRLIRAIAKGGAFWRR